ncbi:hypothetical protein CcI49_28560 [Frankia sp. CcI49]|uniref:DUF397 domain-containing protein n=1 Tax=Frankia sp. CcI49 TaxID=1745382 RepID=UPI0009773F50|nr:DUF397 domain-containing protein [Frankia sp. CcI49]ONH55476.1 hypothetical protein CcI49_28560 [Frankia sp. CcI49]
MEFNNEDGAIKFMTACDGGAGCVEVARGESIVLIRGSRMPEVVVAVSRSEWDEFEQGVKSGGLDGR